LPGPGGQQRSVLDFYCSSEFLKIHSIVTGHVASTQLHFLHGKIIMGDLRGSEYSSKIQCGNPE